MRSRGRDVSPRRGADAHRPQHGLPGAEGLQDRRGRGAARGPRHARSRWRAPAREGSGPAGDREAALGPARRARRAASSSRTGSSTRRASRRSPSTRARPPCTTRARRTTTSPRGWSQSLGAPVILTGGLRDAAAVLRRLRAHRRRRRDARARLARQPVAVRGAARRARAGADARRGPRRARLGRWTARSSTSARARAAATCASSTPGTWRRVGAAEDRAAGAPADGLAGRRAGGAGGPREPAQRGADRRYTAPLALPTTAVAPSPLRAGFVCRPRTTPRQRPPCTRTSSSPRKGSEAQGRAGAAADHPPTRGRRAHQGGPGVRRHLGELRVRRRQERAGDARAAHRAARGAPALGAGHRRQATSRRTPSRSARSSRSRTRRRASRRSSRSSARPRPTRRRASSPTSRRSAAR